MRALPVLICLSCLLAVANPASSIGGDSLTDPTNDLLTSSAWRLLTLAGQTTDPLSRATLRFDTNGTLSGFDGCNRYRGSFSVEGPALHIAGGMATTRMACRELLAKQASAYYQALRHTATFTVENQRLSLRDASGDELAVFAAESQMLAGTHWEVTAYNNGNQAVVSVLGGTHLSARFSDDGQVTGSAGCNQYFAYFQVDAGNITIGLPGATRRFCAEPKGTMDQELAYLTALSSAKTFRLEGDRLTLRTSDGALAVTLVGDTASTPSPTVTAKPKIRFDVERLNAQGLIGPPDGLRALDYEYCIPDQPEVIRQVQAIDPTLQIQKGSPGRVGCDQNQLLCLGNTHQADFRSVLERLAALPFVTAIHQAFFE